MKYPSWVNRWNKYLFYPKVEDKKPEMLIQVYRVHTGKDHTNSDIYINKEFECFGLEDQKQNIKVFGKTRIPSGKYEITFRTIGGFHQKYSNKYGKWHHGMLWIRNVEGFEYILIHIGNNDEDTAGCLLLGQTTKRPKNFIGRSRLAYEAFYPKVRDALNRNEKVYIDFIDIN